MTSQTLPLNLIPKGVCPRLYVSQYDKGQEWNFDIYAGTEAYTIPSGSTVTIQGTKPDKTGFQYACSFSGNRVTATEQQQMTIIAGDVPTEIRIEKNNEIIATLNFIIAVEKAALADDTVISETDLPLIEEAIEVLGHADELVQRIEGDVTTSGNNALKAEGFAVGQQNGSDVASGSPYYHNSAKYYKEQAANSASTASNKASDASGSASAASGSASSASTNALKAEGFAVGQQNGGDVASGSPYYHNSAKYYKEQAADSASTASTKAGEAAASAQAAAQSAAHLTIDSAMSTTSENALQNKVITTTIQNLSNQVSSLEEENGYYNLCPPLTNILTGTGISWQLKDDMSSVANGAATSMNQIATEMFTLEAGTYKINGLPSGGGTSSTFKMWLLDFSSGTETALVQMTSTSDYTFTVTADNKLVLRADVYKNYTASNLNFKPMIRKSDRTSNTYIPYRAKNLKLTQKTIGLIDNQNVNGAVNMIYPIESSKTEGGLVYTLNEDNSLTISGTPNGVSGFAYRNNNGAFLRGKSVRLKINPSTQYANNKWYVAFIFRETEGGSNLARYDLELGGSNYQDEKVVTVPANTNYIMVQFNLNGSTVALNTTVKPILAVESYDGPYVPYSGKSNKELTEDVASLEDNKQPKFISAGDSVTSCRITFTSGHGGAQGSLALVVVDGGFVCLGFWSNKWQRAWANVGQSETVTSSDNDANGITLTFSTSTTVYVLPIYDADGCVITKIT